LDICIRESEAVPGLTTHKEIRPTSFLSNLACTIPLPDFNQSPRNMYQCQMGKQTMASPIHTWHLNSGTSTLLPKRALDPQSLLTSVVDPDPDFCRIRIRNSSNSCRIRIQNSAENGIRIRKKIVSDPQHCFKLIWIQPF
jgi:hypothetical protein